MNLVDPVSLTFEFSSFESFLMMATDRNRGNLVFFDFDFYVDIFVVVVISY